MSKPRAQKPVPPSPPPTGPIGPTLTNFYEVWVLWTPRTDWRWETSFANRQRAEAVARKMIAEMACKAQVRTRGVMDIVYEVEEPPIDLGGA